MDEELKNTIWMCKKDVIYYAKIVHLNREGSDSDRRRLVEASTTLLALKAIESEYAS